MRTRTVLFSGLTTLALASIPAAAIAQVTTPAPRDTVDLREREVKKARQGAGLRVGSWQTTGLTEVSGATYSTIPAFEGYWQKGLDRHLALETSGGLWARTQRSGSDRITSIAIPMFTSIKFYPATGPEQQFEPFISAGGGFTIGIDDRKAAAGGLLGGPGGQTGTAIILGIGAKGSVGAEIHLGRALGLQGGVGYQFIRFLGDVGTNDTYKGVMIFGGLTYRFQY